MLQQSRQTERPASAGARGRPGRLEATGRGEPPAPSATPDVPVTLMKVLDGSPAARRTPAGRRLPRNDALTDVPGQRNGAALILPAHPRTVDHAVRSRAHGHRHRVHVRRRAAVDGRRAPCREPARDRPRCSGASPSRARCWVALRCVVARPLRCRRRAHGAARTDAGDRCSPGCAGARLGALRHERGSFPRAAYAARLRPAASWRRVPSHELRPRHDGHAARSSASRRRTDMDCPASR